MLTLWNGNKGGCSLEKPSRARQGSGISEAAPQGLSCAPETGESRTDGGLGLFPKLQRTVFTLTLEDEAREGGRRRSAPFGLQRWPTHLPMPITPFPSRSPVLSAGTRRSSRPSGLSLSELLGRLAPLERSEGGAAGSGSSAGISAVARSRCLPPHPGGARAADAARPPRADESGEGAGGEGCGTVEGGGDVPTLAQSGRRRPLGGGRAAPCAPEESRGRWTPP